MAGSGQAVDVPGTVARDERDQFFGRGFYATGARGFGAGALVRGYVGKRGNGAGLIS